MSKPDAWRYACANPTVWSLQAVLALQHKPPCVYGAGHAFCAADEPGCSLAQRLAPGDGEAAAVGSAVQRWGDAYAPAAAALRLFAAQRTPLGKVSALRAALRCVAAVVHVEVEAVSEQRRIASAILAAAGGGTQSSAAEGTDPVLDPQPAVRADDVGHGVGADDLIPRLCCLLVQAGVPGLLPQIAYLEETLPDEVANGEEGYTLVTLSGAIGHVRHMAEERLT
jgi:hypothetical protein